MDTGCCTKPVARVLKRRGEEKFSPGAKPDYILVSCTVDLLSGSVSAGHVVGVAGPVVAGSGSSVRGNGGSPSHASPRLCRSELRHTDHPEAIEDCDGNGEAGVDSCLAAKAVVDSAARRLVRGGLIARYMKL